jgi:hypothetical protein
MNWNKREGFLLDCGCVSLQCITYSDRNRDRVFKRPALYLGVPASDPVLRRVVLRSSWVFSLPPGKCWTLSSTFFQPSFVIFPFETMWFQTLNETVNRHTREMVLGIACWFRCLFDNAVCSLNCTKSSGMRSQYSCHSLLLFRQLGLLSVVEKFSTVMLLKIEAF